MKIKLQDVLIPFAFSGLYFLTTYFKGTLDYFDVLFIGIGTTLGVILMYLDESILHRYYLEPHAEKIKLMTRSLLFMISLPPLGLFIVSSTGSKLGIGLFLGIITVLLLELILYKENADFFHSRFMFQLKRKLSSKEIDFFVASFGGLTLVFILLIFFLGR